MTAARNATWGSRWRQDESITPMRDSHEIVSSWPLVQGGTHLLCHHHEGHTILYQDMKHVPLLRVRQAPADRENMASRVTSTRGHVMAMPFSLVDSMPHEVDTPKRTCFHQR